MLMGSRRQIRMQRNHRGSPLGEVPGDRILPGEPGGSFPRPLPVGDDPGHQGLREPQHQGMPILQHIAAVRRDAVGEGGFGGGADGEIEGGHEEIPEPSRARTPGPVIRKSMARPGCLVRGAVGLAASGGSGAIGMMD